MNQSASHVMFADESGYNCGRFRAIAVVNATVEKAKTLENAISAYLSGRNIKEMKWEKVRTDHKRDAALWMIRRVFDESIRGNFRIDVLGWDTQDSRHRIKNRDDVVNLEKMYYHLCRNLMRSRWGKDSIWHLYPDENSAVNWDLVRDTLYAKSMESGGLISAPKLEGTGTKVTIRFRRNYTIADITPVKSELYPLVQVADLFAGLAVYSKIGALPYDKWRTWYKAKLTNDVPGNTPTPTGTEKARSALLNKLGQWIREQPALGYTLDRQKGIYTLDPQSPINFWWYRPQREEDKAPTKNYLRR